MKTLLFPRLPQEQRPPSLRTAMMGMSALFFITAIVLSIIGLCPQAVIAFSGAYLVIAAFLVFISLGVLILSWANMFALEESCSVSFHSCNHFFES